MLLNLVQQSPEVVQHGCLAPDDVQHLALTVYQQDTLLGAPEGTVIGHMEDLCCIAFIASRFLCS